MEDKLGHSKFPFLGFINYNPRNCRGAGSPRRCIRSRGVRRFTTLVTNGVSSWLPLEHSYPVDCHQHYIADAPRKVTQAGQAYKTCIYCADPALLRLYGITATTLPLQRHAPLQQKKQQRVSAVSERHCRRCLSSRSVTAQGAAGNTKLNILKCYGIQFRLANKTW
jgi:hypothetical protein